VDEVPHHDEITQSEVADIIEEGVESDVLFSIVPRYLSEYPLARLINGQWHCASALIGGRGRILLNCDRFGYEAFY
jgi:hypothetical protein